MKSGNIHIYTEEMGSQNGTLRIHLWIGGFVDTLMQYDLRAERLKM